MNKIKKIEEAYSTEPRVASPDQISLEERSSIRDFYKSPFLNKRASFLEFLNVVHLANLGGSYYLEQKEGGLDDIQ